MKETKTAYEKCEETREKIANLWWKKLLQLSSLSPNQEKE